MARGLLALALTVAFSASCPASSVSLSGPWEFRREGGDWTRVRVPHDWAIAGPFDPTASAAEIDSGRLPYSGRGEYRRAFSLSSADAALVRDGGKAYLAFDGVQAHPKVKLNGAFAGGWDYGYASFTLDVTDLVKEGENLLEVSADTTKLKSRWYPGGGICRDVRLEVKPREHVVPGTLAIRPELDADGKGGTVRVSYVCSTLGPTNFEFRVESPRLWSVDSPALYELTVLGERFSYGFRTAKFTADDGFWLNGRRLQLKGVCLHSDLGPLGMAFDVSAARRQLAILKDMGVNAVRTSHNPPAPQFLDLCDRMGFVVWDECFDKWDATSARGTANLEEFVSRNLKAFVRRDRNHPSVVVWSIGNEISPASADYPWGVTRARCRLFREAVLAEDPTRPVGIGAWQSSTVGCFADLDLTGWNYARRYMPMREAFPDKPIVYSESCSSFSDFGFYQVPPARGRADYATAVRKTDGYDMTAAGYSDIPDAEFHRLEKDGFLAGEFVWTGFDYLGEPSPYTADFHKTYYPEVEMSARDYARSSYYGIVDLTGVPKDRFYLYRSLWRTDAETVHVLPHWNWRPGEKVPVFAYASGDEAELFVNGRSLGRRRKLADLDYPVDHFGRDNAPGGDPRTNAYYAVCDKYRFRWYDVPFEPGELKVVAYRRGARIGEAVRRTCGRPVALRLSRDPYSLPSDDLAYVQVDAVDAKGVRAPAAADRVAFRLEGEGEIVSVGNGDPRGYDSFKAVSSHPLYFGKAMVIVRPKGRAKLVASAPGLAPAEFEFTTGKGDGK